MNPVIFAFLYELISGLICRQRISWGLLSRTLVGQKPDHQRMTTRAAVSCIITQIPCLTIDFRRLD